MININMINLYSLAHSVKPFIKKRTLDHLPEAKIRGANKHSNGNIDILARLLHSRHVVVVIRRQKILFCKLKLKAEMKTAELFVTIFF